MRLAFLMSTCAAVLILLLIFGIGHIGKQPCAAWVARQDAGGLGASVHNVWLRIVMAGAEAIWMMQGDGTDPFAGVPHGSRVQRVTKACILNPDRSTGWAVERVAGEIVEP